MSGDKKEQIRQAAIRIIARKGFHATTTDKIAAAAGVAVGTIYNYFKNKEDILDYIFQVEYEKRAAFFRRLQGEDTHPLEKLRSILTMHFTALQENPDLVRVILAERGLLARPPYPEGEAEGLEGFLAQILREGIAAGQVRKCRPELVAGILFGAIEALMARYLTSGAQGTNTAFVKEAVEEIANLLWQGLAAP